MTDRAATSPPPGPSTTSPARPRGRMRRGDQRGAAIVEFVLVIPVFIFVLYGLITYGVILAQKQQITNAAADGARAAVGASNPTQAAQDRVRNSLGTPNGRYTDTYNTSPCVGGTGQCITVNIVWNYAAAPLVPPAPGLGLFTPSTFHSTAIVQYS